MPGRQVKPEFEIVHAAHLHPPYGLWIVRHGGKTIGKQISRPSLGDCEVFLAKHLEGERTAAQVQPRLFSYHRSVASTRRAQRRGGRRKRAALELAK